jgi:hypothetical protein
MKKMKPIVSDMRNPGCVCIGEVVFFPPHSDSTDDFEFITIGMHALVDSNPYACSLFSHSTTIPLPLLLSSLSTNMKQWHDE